MTRVINWSLNRTAREGGRDGGRARNQLYGASGAASGDARVAVGLEQIAPLIGPHDDEPRMTLSRSSLSDFTVRQRP
jgi:hypothetical protein